MWYVWFCYVFSFPMSSPRYSLTLIKKLILSLWDTEISNTDGCKLLDMEIVLYGLLYFRDS